MKITTNNTAPTRPTVEEIRNVGAFFSSYLRAAAGENLFIVNDDGVVTLIRDDNTPYGVPVGLSVIMDRSGITLRLPRPGEVVTITF